MPSASKETEANEAQDGEEGKGDVAADEKAQKKIEQMSGHMFTVMWHLTAMDIRSTLASACRKVTHDHSVSEEIRIMRAKAMLILGKIFMAHGASSKDGLKDLKSRLGSQMGGAASEESQETNGVPDTAEEASATGNPSKGSDFAETSDSGEGGDLD